MLIHHHKHIDIKLGYLIELNSILREIEHNLFLSEIELAKGINLKSFNSELIIYSEDFDQNKCKFKVDLEMEFNKDFKKEFEISLETKISKTNLNLLRNDNRFFKV